jgi:penicillin-binding protein 1A
MTAAYSAFAGRGIRVEPRFVVRVESATGSVLWTSDPEHTKVTEPAVAFLLTDMLADVVDAGTGYGARRAGFRGPAAGKTGTTSDATDVWFVGYTPELVATVWIGFDDVRPLPARATGGSVAAPVWGRIMSRAYDERTVPPSWRAPDEIVSLRVDPETGQALAEGCMPRYVETRREFFLEGHEPMAICPRREDDNLLDRIGGWLGKVFGPTFDPLDAAGEPDPNLGAPRLTPRNRAVVGSPERRRSRSPSNPGS